LWRRARKLPKKPQYRPVLDAIVNTVTLSAPVGGTTDDVDVNLTGDMLLYGDTVDGVVDASGPSVWTFIGLEGEVIDLIVTPEGEFDVVVDVVDESGTSILPNGESRCFLWCGRSARCRRFRPRATTPSSCAALPMPPVITPLSLVEAGTAVVPPPVVTGGDGEPIAYGDLVSGAVDGFNPGGFLLLLLVPPTMSWV
jgi:hypothetical protein